MCVVLMFIISYQQDIWVYILCAAKQFKMNVIMTVAFLRN